MLEVVTNEGIFVEMGGQGSLLLLNVKVNERPYFAMMIRGSNTANSWSDEAAKEDALDLFKYDLFNAFNKSEEVREYMAYPLLEQMLSQIEWKHQNAQQIGYDYIQEREDLQKVRDLAVNTYHLNSTFVDEILNWLETQYPKQSWWEVAPSSWIIGGIVSSVVGIPFALLIEKKVNSNNKTKKKEQDQMAAPLMLTPRTRKEKRESLIEEYKVLHDSIYKRSSTMQTVNTILLPSSVLIIGIAVEYRESINSVFKIGINAAGFLPIFSALLLFVALFFYITTSRVNKVCFERIHVIEEILGIEGHRYILSRIEDLCWWRIRKAAWYILLPLAAFVCALSSYYLFQ
jgi:hypothetical protein